MNADGTPDDRFSYASATDEYTRFTAASATSVTTYTYYVALTLASGEVVQSDLISTLDVVCASSTIELPDTPPATPLWVINDEAPLL